MTTIGNKMYAVKRDRAHNNRKLAQNPKLTMNAGTEYGKYTHICSALMFIRLRHTELAQAMVTSMHNKMNSCTRLLRLQFTVPAISVGSGVVACVGVLGALMCCVVFTVTIFAYKIKLNLRNHVRGRKLRQIRHEITFFCCFLRSVCYNSRTE